MTRVKSAEELLLQPRSREVGGLGPRAIQDQTPAGVYTIQQLPRAVAYWALLIQPLLGL